MEYILEEKKEKKSVVFFAPDDNVEKVINNAIFSVFSDRLGKEKGDEIYLCVKEIVNYFTAINVLRLTNGSVNFDPRVRLLFNDSYLSYFKDKAKAKGKFIEVEIIERNGGVVVEIINSDPIPLDHEKKVRELLRKLSFGEEFNFSLTDDNYNFLYSIFTVWSILKDLGIDRKYFRLGNVEGKAIVRIEIPFSENYVSVRDES